MTDEGLALIRHFEGCKLTAYTCPAGVLTIGYGTTDGVKPGDKITQDMADLMLMRDVWKFEKGVKNLVHYDVNANQLSACTALAYNIGLGNFGNSTLLRMINAGSVEAAAEQFPRWNRSAGRIMAGLVKRREAERLLYLGENWMDAI